MSSSRILPDPDKWVTAKKVERPPLQRPLVDPRFRAHCGIATPPSTGGKGKAPRTKSALQSSQVTPSAPSRGGIQSYLTPPTTGPSHLKRTTLAPLDANAKRTSASRSGKSTSPVKLSKLPPLGKKGSGAAWRAYMAQRIDESGFILGSGPSKEPEPVPATSSGPLKSSSVKLSSPVKEPEPVPTTPSGPSLSQRVLTPVPDSVLARHKQLCGQDSVRRRAAISPWRREEGVDQYNDPDARADREEARRQKEEERAVERERKRLRLDVREAVVSNTTERIRKTKTTRALGEFKSLAHLSSDKSSSPSRSSPSDRIPLAGKSGNANPLRRHSSAVEGPVCERDEDWPTRQPRLPAVTAFSRNHRQDAADDTPKASARPQPIAQSAFPPRQHLARQAEAERPRTTPRKRRAEHHHVTPPKSRTPQHVHQQETLFVLPAPPRQPVFEPVRPAPESIGWQPVSMEAETLMTWSLGGGAGEPEVNKDVPASDNDDCESSFPILVESSPDRDERRLPDSSPPRIHSVHDGGSTPVRGASPSPSDVRQLEAAPFPTSVLQRHRPSPFAAPVQLPEPLPSSGPAQQHETSPKKPLVRHADTRRPKAVPVLLSSLPSAPAESLPKRPSSGRARDSTQAKLAAFGYFRSTPKPTKDFDTSFSDEEDLDFGIEDELDLNSALHSPQLHRVPDAPPHPSLRPPGIQVLSKREEEAMARHKAQRQADKSSSDSPHSPIPPPSTSDFTDTSSSLADDAPRISESTRRWWDELGAASINDIPDL